jgi:predicted nucleic acid-binding Zn ribbon protein
MVVETSQEQMDKCPIDGNYFVPKNGKKVCSDKCKRLWDSQNRRLRNELIKQQKERDVATAEADKEAANARRRRARAEKKAQDEKAKKVQYETPAEAEEWKKPKMTVGQLLFLVVVGVGVLFIIGGLVF